MPMKEVRLSHWAARLTAQGFFMALSEEALSEKARNDAMATAVSRPHCTSWPAAGHHPVEPCVNRSQQTDTQLLPRWCWAGTSVHGDEMLGAPPDVLQEHSYTWPGG